MTLGNNPQPLTRRQARELARAQEPAVSTESYPSAEVGAVVDASVETGRPAEKRLPTSRASEPNSSFTELIQKAEAAAQAQAASTPAGARRRAPAPDDSDQEYLAGLDRTLTRRELRALQAAQAASAESDVDGGEDAADVAQPANVSAGEIPAGDGAVDASASAPVPVSVETVRVPSPASSVRPEPAASRWNTVTNDEIDGIDDVDAEAHSEAPRELNPPLGHWSIEPATDDDILVAEHSLMVDEVPPFDQLLSRGGGIGTTTSNTLLLPVGTTQDRSSVPFAATGEILITGSIDLPRSLGSTGTHPDRFDSADVDHMLDQVDEAGAGADVAPVSASRAVSSHASTRGVMTPPKKNASWLPTVLAVTAAALALGVIALFVGAIFFKIF